MSDETKPQNNKQENLSELYEKSFKKLKEGDVVKGKVVSVTDKEALVDIGYKSEGIIPLSEFSHSESVNIGDEIEILLESKENEDGKVIISKAKAERSKGWKTVIANYKEKDTIEGKIIKKIKGGLIVDIGIEAFLPASLCSLKGPQDMDKMIGKKFEFKIIKITKSRKNVVLSHKDLLLEKKEQKKKELLNTLKSGDLITGNVKNITDFGAFVDLDGLDGLLHITDMSWGRISHPSEMLAIGDKVEVVVLNIDKENRRVSLGIKQKTKNPWSNIEAKYPVESKVKGKIVNILPYGAFIEIEKGIEGLVHVSEISWTKRINDPHEVLAIGDVVETVVLSVDAKKQRISLGMKQIEVDPWLEIQSKYSIGNKVKGKIHNITNYGAFVELEPGIEGLIHILDISWTKKVTHTSKLLKKGQKVEALVLSLDIKSHKMSLGLKQLTPDPWSKICKKYNIDTEWKAKMIEVSKEGISVELEKDVEAIIPNEEFTKKELNLKETFQEKKSISVVIRKIDEQERKIFLGLK